MGSFGAAPVASLRALSLGDIVSFPDGRDMTVRAKVDQLRVTVGPMTGWLLAGEVGPASLLLSLPATETDPVLVYTPLEDLPPFARSASAVVEGVAAYWAPHLPSIAGAMGELGYKVCTVRTSPAPLVLVWRGNELVVFVKSGEIPANMLNVMNLAQPAAASQDVVRYSAAVVKPGERREHAPTPTVPERHLPDVKPRRRRIPLLPRR